MHLERIKNMREDLDMTQKDLAKILNISQRTLSHYELGTRDIPTQTCIFHLSSALFPGIQST